MSAEGTPQEKPSILERPLLGLTRLVLRFPTSTLILGVLVAVATTGWSNAKLGFRTNRLDLLNPKSEFNQRWAEYTQEFTDDEDVVLVVKGAGASQVVPVRNELAATVTREKKLYYSVFSGADPAKLESKGLHYLSIEQLQQIEQFVDRMEPIVRDQWSWLNVGAMAKGMWGELQRSGRQEKAIPPEAVAQLGQFTEALRSSLAGKYQSPWPEMGRPSPRSEEEAESSQLLADQGRVGFVLLKLVKDEKNGDFVRGSKAISRLRDIIAKTQDKHPEVEIGLTGLPVIEHDEMLSSQNSMSEVSLFSLIGVSVLFMVGFGGWRHPLLAVTSLTIGTAWSMGYITLAIGHLNILSSAFAVILIGQGIDFSMYYVAEYQQLRKTVPSSREALLRTVQSVGPSVATGAVTTAVAFFMAGLTEFTGVKELGIIAGGGILLCWIAGLTLLPAMIHLVDTKWPSKHVPVAVDIRSWLEPLLARPKLLLVTTSAFTVIAAFGLTRLWYDNNLLNLQAKNLQSVELEKTLLEKSEHNASFALSIAENREDALARKSRFLELPSVKKVEELASQFPEENAEKRAIIERIYSTLGDLPEHAPNIPVSQPEELAQIVGAAQAMMSQMPDGAAFQRSMGEIARLLQGMTPADCYARISEFQQRMAEELLARLRALRGIATPEPPQLSDLPKSLESRFVSRNGRYLLKVYCKGDVWDVKAMEKFVQDVRTVDKRATGNPLQIYEASLQMKRSYEEAALYAMAIILPVVFVEFLSIRHTLLALLPLGVGMLQMFGLMGLLNIPLNPANMIVLPLILGIGIDAGVHVVHDYCSQRGRYRINASTASAVVINTATNMAGFGALMIASHRGLQSLGRVLTLGLACCLFTSLVMLPAALILMSRGRKDPVDEAEEAVEEEVTPVQRVYRRGLRQVAEEEGEDLAVAASRRRRSVA